VTQEREREKKARASARERKRESALSRPPPILSTLASLRLNAEDLELNVIKIDGETVPAESYSYPKKDVLEIKGLPEGPFELETEVVIKPEGNTQLSGLYKSSGVYCTQCEAEGFRRITPMLDRPDIMATYKVRLEADKKSCPVLLSNGNLVNKGDMADGRHFTEWVDPFKKPSYLFAAVAGDLGSIKDSFTTKSGRKVALEIFSEHNNVDQLYWAMQSLKDAMKWDGEARSSLACVMHACPATDAPPAAVPVCPVCQPLPT
jgi:aminopeptidase N